MVGEREHEDTKGDAGRDREGAHMDNKTLYKSKEARGVEMLGWTVGAENEEERKEQLGFSTPISSTLSLSPSVVPSALPRLSRSQVLAGSLHSSFLIRSSSAQQLCFSCPLTPDCGAA